MNTHIKVTLTGITDDSFPVWLSFEFTDWHGTKHQFIDKAPVILDPDTAIPEIFPVETHIPCAMTEHHGGFVIIHLLEPEGLVSSEGDFLFEVSPELIKGLPSC